MSQEKTPILTKIQDRLNTIDLKQELLSNDLDSALSLDRENGTLTLESPHPNHPEDMRYVIRHNPEEGILRIGISTSSPEIRSKLDDYAGEFRTGGFEYHDGRSEKDIIDKEWSMQDSQRDSLIEDVADDFYWLVASSHRMFS